MKRCNKCGVLKDLTDFYGNKGNKDGLSYKCKSCFKVYYEENKRPIAAKVREYQAKNKESIAARTREYQAKNKESIAARTREYRLNNRGARNAIKAKRRSAKLQRTVSWADLEAIKNLYKEARRLTEATGILFHVDHIIPLQGNSVSGLHVEGNLQLLTAHENLSKSNKF